MKICTDISQSNKFLDLGIDINTSDMMWIALNWQETDYYMEVKNDGFEMPKRYIPAWSLSALMELIPPYLGELDAGIDFSFGKAIHSKWYSAYYLQYFQDGGVMAVKTVTGDTAVDAAFEMVVWLKESGKI